MTIELKPEVAAALEALASSQGVTIEEYLERLVERELPHESKDSSGEAGASGMVWEEGLYVYRTGRPLPQHVLDDAIHRVREDRARQIMGDLS
jgi:methionine salvage enolase-phosphatase E1